MAQASAAQAHASRHGGSKLPRDRAPPLAGRGVADRIITDLGVFEVAEGGRAIVALADGVTEATLA